MTFLKIYVVDTVCTPTTSPMVSPKKRHTSTVKWSQIGVALMFLKKIFSLIFVRVMKCNSIRDMVI